MELYNAKEMSVVEVKLHSMIETIEVYHICQIKIMESKHAEEILS